MMNCPSSTQLLAAADAYRASLVMPVAIRQTCVGSRESFIALLCFVLAESCNCHAFVQHGPCG